MITPTQCDNKSILESTQTHYVNANLYLVIPTHAKIITYAVAMTFTF